MVEEIRKAILADLVGFIETSMGSCVVEKHGQEIEYKWRNGGTSEIEIVSLEGERRLVTFEVDVRVETNVSLEE